MSAFQPWLVILGLGLDIWGVLLIINEWRLGSLADQFEAIKSDILFYRNLRHKFTPEEAKHIHEARLSKEVELARVYGETRDISARYERRRRLIKRGRALIVSGFLLQMIGSFPIAQLACDVSSAGVVCRLLNSFWTIGIGILAVAVVTLLVLRWRRFGMVALDSLDGKFTGEWMSSERSVDPNQLDLLWLNIESKKGSIIGITRPNSIEIDEWNRFLEIRGKRHGESAELQVTDYSGTEPHSSATAVISLEGNELVWQLKHDGIGNFPKQSRLYRLSG